MVHQTGWFDWEEWARACDSLFPETGALRAPCTAESPWLEHASVEELLERLEAWRSGLAIMKRWKLKACKLPRMVIATMEIMHAVLMDWQNDLDKRSGETPLVRDDTMVTRLAMNMTVIRTVNLVVDDLQDGAYAQSILELASKVNLPKWIVELRHEATHQERLPSLQMVRLAVDALLHWIKDYYWLKQKRLIVANPKVEARLAKLCKEQLDMIEGMMHDNTGDHLDEIDECVDKITSQLPMHLMQACLIPHLVGVLTNPKQKHAPSPDRPNNYYKWERVLAGFDDTFQGLAVALMESLCEVVLTADQKKPTVQTDAKLTKKRKHSHDNKKQVNDTEETKSKSNEDEEDGSDDPDKHAALCLSWIKYFISRRWYSLGDESIGVYTVKSKKKGKKNSSSPATVNLVNTHPSNWTKKQREWVFSPAPSPLHDSVFLRRCLRRAFDNPHPWAQRLIAALLPALCINTTTQALGIATDLIRIHFGTDTIRAPEMSLEQQELKTLLQEDHEEESGAVMNGGAWQAVPSSWEPIPIGSIVSGSATLQHSQDVSESHGVHATAAEDDEESPSGEMDVEDVLNANQEHQQVQVTVLGKQLNLCPDDVAEAVVKKARLLW